MPALPEKAVGVSHQIRGWEMKVGPGADWGDQTKTAHSQSNPSGSGPGPGTDVGKCQPPLLHPCCHRPCAIRAYTHSHFTPNNLSPGRLKGWER